MRFLNNILLVLVTLAAASEAFAGAAQGSGIRAFTAADLSAAGFPIGEGTGRVDGTNLSLAAMARFGEPEDMAARLKNKLAGRFTVSFAPGSIGQVLIIADIRSRQCPACALPSLGTLDEIMAKTYALTFVQLPGGATLAFGSDAGKLAAQAAATKDHQSSPLSYDGVVFNPDAKDWKVDHSSSFKFNGAAATTTDATSNETATYVASQLRNSLRVQGFRLLDESKALKGMHETDPSLGFSEASLGPSSQTASALAEETWGHGGTTISFAVTPGDAGLKTRMTIHEVSVQQ